MNVFVVEAEEFSLEHSTTLCYPLDRKRRLLVTDTPRELPIDG